MTGPYNISPEMLGKIVIGGMAIIALCIIISKFLKDLKTSLTDNLVTKRELDAALTQFRQDLEGDLVTTGDLENAMLKQNEKLVSGLTETRHSLRGEMQASQLLVQANYQHVESELKSHGLALARIEEHLKK